MSRYRALTFLVLVGPLVSCGDATTPNPFVVSHSAVIEVHDNLFDPNDVTVRSGDDVTWLWKNKTKHSLHFLGEAAADKPPSDSGTISGRVFTNPGIYYYYCDIHGSPSGLSVTGMSGKITVTQ